MNRTESSQLGRLNAGKRSFDIVTGIVLSLLTLPLVLVLVLVSAIAFRTNPFFVQERVGLDGRSFRCIKIRSLAPHTPAYMHKGELIDHEVDHLRGWAGLIRKLHLDELPQFWLVIGGSMSMVGPRPMISSIVDGMPTEIAAQRHSVRPGVTGPWQISVDGGHLLTDDCHYDLAYIQHASLWLDLRIFLWTAAQTVGVPKRSFPEVLSMMRAEVDNAVVGFTQRSVADEAIDGECFGSVQAREASQR